MKFEFTNETGIFRICYQESPFLALHAWTPIINNPQCYISGFIVSEGTAQRGTYLEYGYKFRYTRYMPREDCPILHHHLDCPECSDDTFQLLLKKHRFT